MYYVKRIIRGSLDTHSCNLKELTSVVIEDGLGNEFSLEALDFLPRFFNYNSDADVFSVKDGCSFLIKYNGFQQILYAMSRDEYRLSKHINFRGILKSWDGIDVPQFYIQTVSNDCTVFGNTFSLMRLLIEMPDYCSLVGNRIYIRIGRFEDLTGDFIPYSPVRFDGMLKCTYERVLEYSIDNVGKKMLWNLKQRR